MKTWIRACVAAAIIALFAVGACGDDDDDDDNDDDAGVTASGNAFSFPDYSLIEGATITVLEDDTKTATVDADGYWEIGGLEPGTQASFVLTATGYPEAQTKTFTVSNEDIGRITFQVPSQRMFDQLALLLELDVDPDKCQMVTTVTRPNKSIYDEGAHGEAGATVTTTPEIPEESGPVYFNEDVLPDPTYTESSDDGGVLWTNVDPGVYTIHGHKDGVEFVEPVMTCRAGVLVNASPPYGLQALE